MKRTVCLVLAMSAVDGSEPAVAAVPIAAATPEILARPAAALAQTNALMLENAIRLALEHNPELRAAGRQIDAAEGRAYQAWLWPNPELELSTEDGPATGALISRAQQTIGVVQTLPFPGKKKLDREIGLAGVHLTEAESSLRRREVVREVKTAFFSALAAERLVEVAGDLVEVAESSAGTARKRVEAGAAPDQEMLRAEITLEAARTELAGFQREAFAARQTLATLLGRPDLADVPLSGTLAESVDPALLGDLPERWLPTHPSVVAARVNRQRAELQLRRARLEPYPDVRFGVAGGREGGSDRASVIEFRVSIPLPIIDRSKGRKMEARANLEIAEAEAVAIEQRLLRAWNVASKRFHTAAEQVTAYRERILPKANQALRLVQTGFEEGKFGFIDLLDTQRTTAQAHLAYEQKLLEFNTALADLESFLGAPPPGKPAIPSRSN